MDQHLTTKHNSTKNNAIKLQMHSIARERETSIVSGERDRGRESKQTTC